MMMIIIKETYAVLQARGENDIEEGQVLFILWPNFELSKQLLKKTVFD